VNGFEDKQTKNNDGWQHATYEERSFLNKGVPRLLILI